jgi:regulator of sigma E protease
VGGLETAFWVMVLLGIMILVHELGHYWAALACGVKVETFSFGFGPRLFGARRGETDFRVSLIPFGGYVRMAGELPGDEKTGDPRSFQAKPRWQRVIVVFAGPVMNILLAIVALTAVYTQHFPKAVTSVNPVISRILPGSPAAQAGLQVGDRILQIDDLQHPTWQEVATKEVLNGGHTLEVVAERNGKPGNYRVTPELDVKEGVGVAGWYGEPDVQIMEATPGKAAANAGLKAGDLLVSIQGAPIGSPDKAQTVISSFGGAPVDVVFLRDSHVQKITVQPFRNPESEKQWLIGVKIANNTKIVKLDLKDALIESVRTNRQNATLIFQGLDGIVKRRISAKTIEGPIGIAKLSKEAAHEGLLPFLWLMSIVSLNLAIFNLLPIPILDGGRLMLLFIEMIIRRDVSVQVQETIFKLGFVFLMMIVVFVLYNDISKMITNG